MIPDAAPHRVVVKYATADGTATQGSDYTQTFATVTLEPGVTTKVISVPILDDALDEVDETFKVNIQSASPGIITAGQSTVSILDDDPPPSISINDVSIVEGNSGIRNLVFILSLSAPSGKQVTVNYATADDTAKAVEDYTPATGTVTISPEQTIGLITIQIKVDTLSEASETFAVNLSNPVNATIADSIGIGTITNDDSPILATEQNSQRAIALDLLTLIRDPFPLNNPGYFGPDHRTRISLFTTNLIVTPGLVVTAQGMDSQNTVYELPVESIVALPEAVGLVQVIVRLPDGIPAGDLRLSITARGRTSNVVLVGNTP